MTEEESNKSLDLKEEGNAFFRNGEGETAIMYYYHAVLELSENETKLKVLLYGNISLCYFKANEYHVSLSFANRALSLDNEYPKAVLIKARCCVQFGQIQLAQYTLMNAIKKQPSVKVFQNELHKIEKNEKCGNLTMKEIQLLKSPIIYLEGFVKEKRGKIFQYEKVSIQSKVRKFGSKLINDKKQAFSNVRNEYGKSKWYQETLNKMCDFLRVNIIDRNFSKRFDKVMGELIQIWSLNDDDVRIVCVCFLTSFATESNLAQQMISSKYQILQRLLEFLYNCLRKDMKRGILRCLKCLKFLSQHVQNNFPADMVKIGRELLDYVFLHRSLSSIVESREVIHILGHFCPEQAYGVGWAEDKRKRVCRILSIIAEEGRTFDESTRIHSVQALIYIVRTVKELQDFDLTKRVCFGYLTSPSLTIRKVVFKRLDDMYQVASGTPGPNRANQFHFVQNIINLPFTVQERIIHDQNESIIYQHSKHVRTLYKIFLDCMDFSKPPSSFVESGLKIVSTFYRRQFLPEISPVPDDYKKLDDKEREKLPRFDDILRKICHELKKKGYHREYFMLKCKHLAKRGMYEDAKQLSSLAMKQVPKEYFFHYIYSLSWSTPEKNWRKYVENNERGIDLAGKHRNYVVATFHHNLAQIYSYLGFRGKSDYETDKYFAKAMKYCDTFLKMSPFDDKNRLHVLFLKMRCYFILYSPEPFFIKGWKELLEEWGMLCKISKIVYDCDTFKGRQSFLDEIERHKEDIKEFSFKFSSKKWGDRGLPYLYLQKKINFDFENYGSNNNNNNNSNNNNNNKIRDEDLKKEIEITEEEEEEETEETEEEKQKLKNKKKNTKNSAASLGGNNNNNNNHNHNNKNIDKTKTFCELEVLPLELHYSHVF